MVNGFEKQNWSKLKMELNFSVFKLLMIIRLFFGNYCNLSSSRIINLAIRLYTVVICVVFGAIRLYEKNSLLIQVLTSVEFIVNCILTQITSEKYFFKFCANIKAIDKNMGFKNLSLPTPTFMLISFLIIAGRLYLLSYIFTIGTVFTYEFSQLHVAATGFTLFAIDLNQLTIIMIFAIMFDRMKILKKEFEGYTVSVNIVGRREINQQINRLKRYRMYYTDLLNTLHGVDNELQLLVIVDSIFFVKV